MNTLHRQLLLPCACLLALGAGFLVYGSTGHDDSHINFWNVHTLLVQGELVNYNGERVQQTTSLLQDCITAALALATPFSLVTLGYLVDITAALGCCVLGTALARLLAPPLAGWVPWLALSCSNFLLWAYGGMGALLAAFVLLVAIQQWWRWLSVASPGPGPGDYGRLLAVTLAVVLVRPEMPLVATAITTALTVFFWRQPALRARCLLLAGLTTAAMALLFLWQHWYFGSWLPIPAVAKQGGSFSDQLLRGTRYWLLSSYQAPLLAITLLLATLPCWQLARRWWQRQAAPGDELLAVVCCSFLAYAGFVWVAGGDWMQAGRFLVPAVLPACLLLLWALAHLPSRAVAIVLLAVLVTLQLGQQYRMIGNTSHGIPAWVERRMLPEHVGRYSVFEQLNQEHVRDMAVIDRLAGMIPVLHAHLQRPVRLMSGQAGMVFYYTASRFPGQVHFRDLRGLVESSLTLCPLLQDVPRSPQGLFWGYRDFFARLPALQQQCGIEPPDIIYDLNDMNQKMGKTLEPQGYTLVHRESGFVVENRYPLPYNRLLSPNMIFVRNELLSLLPEPRNIVLDYSSLPLEPRWPLSHAQP